MSLGTTERRDSACIDRGSEPPRPLAAILRDAKARVVPTTVSPLLHHSFTPMVFRQLHYCKVANSPQPRGCNSPNLPLAPYNCLTTV